MSSWILILSTYYGIVTIDFNTYLGCEQAKQELIKARIIFSNPAICIERK